MTAADFKKKWSRYQGKETSAYQSHFDDLCRLLGDRRYNIRVYLCSSVVYSSPRETDFLERQRPARRAEEKLSGVSRRREARRAVPAGNQMPARPGGAALAGDLHDVLELCGKEGLLRHGDLHQDPADQGHSPH